MSTCCCNKKIPKSTSRTFILRPTSHKYINGIASRYEVKYFPELEPYIKSNDFIKPLDSLITDLQMSWACPLCFCFGYTCSVCTLGLSFLGPYVCIYQAIQRFENGIEEVNKLKYNPRGVNLSLKRACCTSWLQVDIISDTNENETRREKTGNKDNNNNIDSDVVLCKDQPMSMNK